MSASTEITVLYLIKQVELAVRSRLDTIAARHDLTALQYTAMTVLERHPGMTSAELARSSFVRAQTMAQMVTHLETRGLLARERDPQSRRQFRMSLSADGRAILDDLRESVASIEAEMLESFTAAESRQLREALRACRVALSGSNPP